MKLVTKVVKSVVFTHIHPKATHFTTLDIWEDLSQIIALRLGFIASWSHVYVNFRNE